MLPSPIAESYQEFKQALEHLQKIVASENFEHSLLARNWQEVQQIRQRQIASLTEASHLTSNIPRWQSWQTEIHRLLRLLEMDVMFIQAARQSATAQTRRLAMCDRLNMLIGYCEVILQIE